MGVQLIKGIDVGEIPPTPAHPVFDSADVTPFAYRQILKYGQLYGFPISYIQEQQGLLVQNLLPVHKTESQQISTSSRVELELHTETAFHPFKPTSLLLLCVRGDDNAVTTYAELGDFFGLLSEEAIEVLQQPLFRTSLDDSFRTEGQPDFEMTTSVLRKDEYREKNGAPLDQVWQMTYDANLMRGITTEAQDALDELANDIQSCIKEITLETGDLLVINNLNTVHGRRPFQARYDGTDRWVQRLLVINPLPPSSHRDGWIITTKFGQ